MMEQPSRLRCAEQEPGTDAREDSGPARGACLQHPLDWRKGRETPASCPARPRRASRLAVPLLLLLLAGLVALTAVVLVKYQELAAQVSGMQLVINKNLTARLNDTFPVQATFTNDFSVKLDEEIPVKFPVKTVLSVPIFETIRVPMDEPLSVELNQPVQIRETVRVKMDVPVDTVVEAKILGITKKIPIKGVVPIDLNVPINQEFRIKESLDVHMNKPLDVKVAQVVEAPIDFVVRGVMPLKQEIKAPINEVLDCSITMDHELPLLLDLGISFQDWGKGLRVEEQGEGLKQK